jgi:hypothetical protein
VERKDMKAYLAQALGWMTATDMAAAGETPASIAS